MNKNLVFVVLGILLIGLMGCEIKTPEIRGVVLDEETKQPVEGAWVRAVIGIKTKTVAGDVGQVMSLHQPHTRTGKDGRFVIPRMKLKKPLFPAGFGTKVDDAVITAHTVDDRIASVRLEGEELKRFLRKDEVNLTLYRKHVKWTEEEYFSYLQTLYNYCLTGRYGIEIPKVEGGCDEWELDYAITKHKRYLEKYPKTEETRSPYSIVLEQLGFLHERKGEHEKALENLKRAKEIRFFRPQDLENEIKRIQNIIQEKQR